MGKIKKRRRSTHQTEVSLYNLTGSGSQPQADESIDDLMAEMDGSAPTAVLPEPPADEEAPVDSDDVAPWDFSKNVLTDKNKDRTLTWNNNLRIWIKNGKYSESLLPNFDVELARHFHVEKLSKFLLRAADDLKMPTFERWMIDSKIVEEKCLDPVLPVAEIETEASRRLVKELCQKLASSKAEEVVQDLCHQTNAALQELTILQRRTIKKSPLGKGDRVDVEDRQDSMMKALVYKRKGWKKPYCIKLNVSHYNKLQEMYERVHGKLVSKSATKTGGGATHAFHLITMCLLLRYSSLSGGQLLNDLRGGGMQGAIQPHVFATLQRQLGMPCVEAFASPLNAYYPQFGSAFPDIDWHFGSVGDFFDAKLFTEGCYEANPPFSPGFMMKMATTMEERLVRADKRNKALTFVVIVPSAAVGSTTTSLAKDFANPSFELLTKLSSQHYILKSREHGYVEGAQHMKPTRYKQSPYDTSVFLLQSKVAAAKTNCALEEPIRAAFASKHEEEIQQRKLAAAAEDGSSSDDESE